MKVLRADETFLQAINEIDQMAFDHPWSKLELQASLTSPLSVYLVAVNEDKVVGYIGYYTTGDILNIAVHPNYRRCGIGKLLIDKAIANAKLLEMDSLILEVRESNISAIELYKSMGFEYINKRLNYYQGKENALIYIKHLV